MQFWYTKKADWDYEWASMYSSSELPATQIAPMTWMAVFLTVLETPKLVTAKWDPVVFPHYWKITPTSAAVKEFVSHTDKDDEDDGEEDGEEGEKKLIMER